MYLYAWCSVSQETLADTSSPFDKKDFLVTLVLGGWACGWVGGWVTHGDRWFAACGCQAWSLTAEHRHPVPQLDFQGGCLLFQLRHVPVLPPQATPDSPNLGKVLNVESTPYSGTQPHHCGIDNTRKVRADVHVHGCVACMHACCACVPGRTGCCMHRLRRSVCAGMLTP